MWKNGILGKSNKIKKLTMARMERDKIQIVCSFLETSRCSGLASLFILFSSNFILTFFLFLLKFIVSCNRPFIMIEIYRRNIAIISFLSTTFNKILDFAINIAHF